MLIFQEAEPTLASGVSHRSLSLDKRSPELMTDGLMGLGGMIDNETTIGDRSWVNQQLSELQNENDELRLSQLQVIETKDREISHLKKQVGERLV